MTRIFRFGAALTCAVALAGAPAIPTQRGHAAPHGGGHVGAVHAGHVGGVHGGHVGVAHVHAGHGYYGHGYYGHGYYGHGHGNVFALSVGLGFGYGGYGYGYGGYGYGYPVYAYPAVYSYPYDYGSYPLYSAGYASPVVTSPATIAADPPVVADPSGYATPEPPPARPNAASMDVRVPDANAEVLVDGRPTRARGRSRTLVSPELTPGKVYVYKLTASWNQDGHRVSEERTVEVTAGKTSVVDFTRGTGDDLPFPKEVDLPKLPPVSK